MKTIVIEFTEEEAKKTSDALKNLSGDFDKFISSTVEGWFKEHLIDDKNQVDNAKNKIDKALGNVLVRG